MKGIVFLDEQESIIPYIAIDRRKEVHPRLSGTAGYSNMQIRMCLSLIRFHKPYYIFCFSLLCLSLPYINN